MRAEIDFGEIKARVSMVEVLKVYGVEPNDYGFILCPFHMEHTPSCKVYRDKLFCFGCGASADIMDFVSHTDGVDFMGAVKRLNEMFGLGLALNGVLPPFDRLVYSIRKKTAEVEETRYKAMLKPQYNNGVMKLETELRNAKNRLFGGDFDGEITEYLKRRYITRS
jgi:DNA primase